MKHTVFLLTIITLVGLNGTRSYSMDDNLKKGLKIGALVITTAVATGVTMEGILPRIKRLLRIEEENPQASLTEKLNLQEQKINQLSHAMELGFKEPQSDGYAGNFQAARDCLLQDYKNSIEPGLKELTYSSESPQELPQISESPHSSDIES